MDAKTIRMETNNEMQKYRIMKSENSFKFGQSANIKDRIRAT